MRKLIAPVIVGLLLAAPLSASLAKKTRELLRDNGSEIGFVIGADRAADGVTVDVLVYSNLVEAMVTCVTVQDVQRVDEDMALGAALWVVASGQVNDRGCAIADLWKPDDDKEIQQAVVGLRHELAVYLYGIHNPEALERFIGTGELHFRRAALEAIGRDTPLIVSAFEVWGINLLEFSGSAERQRESANRIESLTADLAWAQRDLDKARADFAQLVEQRAKLSIHLSEVERIVRELRPPRHHAGLEEAVALLREIVNDDE